MTLSRPEASRVLVMACLGLNVGVVGMDLARGQFRLAALQSIALLFITAWLWFMPRVQDLLDAHVGEAVARRRMTERSLEVVEQQMRAGHVRVNITGGVENRMN